MKTKFITYLVLIPLVAALFIYWPGDDNSGSEQEELPGASYMNDSYENYDQAEIAGDPYPEEPETETTLEPLDESEILGFAEKEPSFPGGEVAMADFIRENIRYPEWEKENGVQGTVYVQFVVDKEGNIRDTEIVKDVPGSQNLGNEVIRMMKTMPNWEPGEQDGEKVNVRFTLPVNFKIK